jgi:DNA-binding response OmpR family regulator
VARILLVDDDTRTAQFIRDHFRGAGHECLVVDRGEKVLDIARAQAVDLLVLDVMLPGGTSGFEVCRRVRADSELYTLPVLILSAMSADEEVVHGLAQGADDYVTKPFDVQNLLQHSEALIRANSDARALDELTTLPNGNAVKREVQRRVSRQEIFALASVELLNLREFAYRCGQEARQKAIRHLARALCICGREQSNAEFMVGHMGGGFFVSIVKPDQVEAYCQRVMQVWEHHLPALYENAGVGQAYKDTLAGTATNKIPILKLLVCVSARSRKESLNAKELFDILMKIRTNALAKQANGIYLDRRG